MVVLEGVWVPGYTGCNTSLFCTCLLQHLELSAVAELLLHIGGVSMTKIQLCSAGRFVVRYVTSCLQTVTENSYAIYFIAWEGKEHLSSALKCPVTVQGWLVCREQVSSSCRLKT